MPTATKEVTKGETKQEVSSIDSFIAQAIQTNLPVESLERLFALREKAQAEIAKASFVEAMAQFQSECPIIEKKKAVMNKDGRTIRYKYAQIESIIEQVKTALSNAKLSYRWETKQEGKSVESTCYITHILGHSESSTFIVEVDTEGYMTAPQKSASALTFAKRYSFCNALGIATGDEDTDANDVNKTPDAKSPKARIVFLLRKLGTESKDKAEIENAVMTLTQLELKEENFEEIIGRMELLIAEKEEYDNSKV